MNRLKGDRERATQIIQTLNRDDMQSGSYQEAAEAEVVLPFSLRKTPGLDVNKV
ncbi:MAG: hypothetical protein HC866_14845 [Leptolyngbyaceae cyanobacterium RU_5_1]|nr:hypothetical protein [Leptolyngbyaceae cyanobacterium RU_5_1]